MVFVVVFGSRHRRRTLRLRHRSRFGVGFNFARRGVCRVRRLLRRRFARRQQKAEGNKQGGVFHGKHPLNRDCISTKIMRVRSSGLHNSVSEVDFGSDRMKEATDRVGCLRSDAVDVEEVFASRLFDGLEAAEVAKEITLGF